MEAAEALVQKVLEGTKQFLVPHFQRPYAWRDEQWRVLWDDLAERVAAPDAPPHFIGSIVTSPARSIPEGVEKRLLIDGQQRLTTLVVLLTAIRDEARRNGDQRLAERIQDLVTNRHEDGNDRFKLLPTQGESTEDSDRAALAALVDEKPTSSKSGILAARQFFDKRVRSRGATTPEQLFTALSRKLSLVSIILGEKDNPHRIFESLNGKGRPLTQGDLIRNFFFMRLDHRDHEHAYSELWRPMQRRLGEETLTDFIRHDLTATSGTVIRETDVYTALKARVDDGGDPMAHLRRLAEHSRHYEILLDPSRSPSAAIRSRLERVKRLDITVAYPLFLPAIAEHAQGRLSDAQLCSLVDVVESYMVRRFVCGIPTYGLNRVFAPLFMNHQPLDDGFVTRVAETLARRECPRDALFRDRLQSVRLYGGGERRERAKLILERLEAIAGHKEYVDPATLTIEHVMPQTLTDEWTQELGGEASETHSDLLHTLGNLTLTGYNSELGNLPFAKKRERYAGSHVELNSWFGGVERWTRVEIERRAAALAEQALRAWPWFGAPGEAENDSDEEEEGVAGGELRVTGTVPRELIIRGKTYPVRSWVEVAKALGTLLADVDDGTFDDIAAARPRFIGRDPTVFPRTTRIVKLTGDRYMSLNLSAAAIYRSTRDALDRCGYRRDEWTVTFDDDDDSSRPETTTELRAEQLEFWTEARKALAAAGVFHTLREPAPQMWFDVALGRAGVHMSLSVSFWDRRVGARIVMMPGKAEKALPQLTAHKSAIESELGLSLNWDPFPEKKVRTIALWMPIDVTVRESWPAAIDWLTTAAVKLYKAFAPRVQALEL